MPSGALPLTNFQSPQSLRLGCLIVNTNDIDQRIHDPFQDRPTASDINAKDLGCYHETQELSKSSKITSFLSDVLSISRERRHDVACSLTAPQFTTHKLRNHSSWFQDACGIPGTRRWLEDAVSNRHDVYLLVGFFILRDAKLAKNHTSGSAGAGGVEIPILPNGLAIMNTMITIASGIKCTTDTTFGRMSLLDIPGENIFGIWYRKVKFKWSFSREAGVPSLGDKTRWKPFWGSGPGVGDGGDDESCNYSEEEEEDILEATLEDESDWDEDSDCSYGKGCR